MRLLLALFAVLWAVVAAWAVTPIAATGGINAMVILNKPGRLYHIYAVNHTVTAGYLAVVNSTTVPADGPINPLACSRLPASGVAEIAYTQEPASFSVGITAVLTSAATCLTKTTGTITGYVAALAE